MNPLECLSLDFIIVRDLNPTNRSHRVGGIKSGSSRCTRSISLPNVTQFY